MPGAAHWTWVVDTQVDDSGCPPPSRAGSFSRFGIQPTHRHWAGGGGPGEGHLTAREQRHIGPVSWMAVGWGHGWDHDLVATGAEG